MADDIVHGRIAPGEPLDETRLARAFGVSRTPIREAIRQLEAIGLAEARPHRGAVAASITAKRLDEMFSVMAELEALCARWAATTMTPKQRRDLEQMHAEGGLLVSRGSIADYADYNITFHDTVYAGANNSFVAELAQSVRQRLAPFRKAQFEGMNRLTKSHVEHDRVVRAILRGDGDAAAGHMREHMVVVRDAVDDVVAPSGRRAAPGEPDQASASQTSAGAAAADLLSR